VYGLITLIAILLVGSVIVLIICMTWRLSGKDYAVASPFPQASLWQSGSHHDTGTIRLW
jgi:hypothetical protein